MATLRYGALELNPAPQVGLSIDSKFFGADVRYSRTKNYTLRGTLLSFQTSGISGISTQHEQIATGFQLDYQPFLINNELIGYPKVKSVSFDNGPLVQKSSYSIELEVLDSGNPFQLSGIYYGLSSVTGLFHNIQNLSETLEYNTDFRTFESTHSIRIQYYTGNGITPTLNGKIIASGLIASKSGFPFFVSGGPFGYKTYEEIEDVFEGSYDVTERFNGTTGTDPYSHTYNLRIELTDNGFARVVQDGTIKGLSSDRYGSAKSGYSDVVRGIYSNCSGIYSRYLGGALNDTHLTDSRADDVTRGQIKYSRSFTDETGVSDVRWKWGQEINLDQNAFQAFERGTVNGLGHASRRFVQASGFFSTIVTGIKARILEQFSGYGFTGDLYNNTQERSFNQFQGVVGYNYGYANLPGLGVGSGVFQYDINVDDTLPVANRVRFNVLGIGTIVQPLNSTHIGTRAVVIRTQGFRNTPQQTIFDFVKNKINEFRPTDASFLDPFLTSLNTTYNPVDNTLEANASFSYGGSKSDTSPYI